MWGLLLGRYIVDFHWDDLIVLLIVLTGLLTTSFRYLKGSLPLGFLKGYIKILLIS
jgi:hypothetical protein